MTSGSGTLCFGCERLNLGHGGSPTCEAFPAGIPNEIFYGLADHRRPFKGDGGVRFLQSTAPGAAANTQAFDALQRERMTVGR